MAQSRGAVGGPMGPRLWRTATYQMQQHNADVLAQADASPFARPRAVSPRRRPTELETSFPVGGSAPRSRPADLQEDGRAAQRLRVRSPGASLFSPAVLGFRISACPFPDAASQALLSPRVGSPAPPRTPEVQLTTVLKVIPGDAPALQNMLSAVERGAMRGHAAEDADLNSVGGAYFLHDDARSRVGVFKPCDEEAFAPNNPRNYRSPTPGTGPKLKEPTSAFGGADRPEMARAVSLDGGGGDGSMGVMKRGIAPQSSAVREMAAYLLDAGMAGVPRTAYVAYKGALGKNPASGEKLGSFQEYIDHLGHSEDWSPSMFDLHDVQAIAALDIRLLNQDRHTGNMLVCDALDADPGMNTVFGTDLGLSPFPPTFGTGIAAFSPRSTASPSPTRMPRDVYAYTHIPCHISRKSGFAAPPCTPSKVRDLQPHLVFSLKAGEMISPRSVEMPLHEMPPSLRPPAMPRALKSIKSCPGALTDQVREQKTPPPLVDQPRKLRLVPIDHGFTMPHPLACDEASLAWMAWPQAKRPLSPGLRGSIAAIDLEADVALLERMFGAERGPLALPRDAVMSLRVGTVLLKVGVDKGRSLYDLGTLITGPDGNSRFPPAENAVHGMVLRALTAYRRHFAAPHANLADTLGAPARSRAAAAFVELFGDEVAASLLETRREHRSPTM